MPARDRSLYDCEDRKTGRARKGGLMEGAVAGVRARVDRGAGLDSGYEITSFVSDQQTFYTGNNEYN